MAKKIYVREDTTTEKPAGKRVIDAGEIDVDPFTALAQEEADHEIKYRTLSWQKATLLLFGEYVCLAILALSWSWSVVGWVAGFFITFGVGVVTWCEFLSVAPHLSDNPHPISIFNRSYSPHIYIIHRSGSS